MTYDLTREPWIPVAWRDPTGKPDAVGLRDAMKQAHEITDVLGDTPLQTAALYRLLQALFLRLYVVPTGHEAWDDGEWLTLWQAPAFSAERADAYFDAWSHRFDLLHPVRPFYGYPAPDKPNEGPLSWMQPELAKGNAARLFDHTSDAVNTALTLSEAARVVVAAQAYGLGGLAGPGRAPYREGHLVSGLMFWLRGDNLKQALLLNTIPSAHFALHPDDAPTWEHDHLPDDDERPHRGYLDFLTWQSRQPHLVVDEDRVVDVHFRRGAKWDAPVTDPLVARRYTADRKKVIPFKLRPKRTLWRDASVWLGLSLSEAERAGYPPQTFGVLSQIVQYDALPELRTARWSAEAFGLANDQAKMEHTRHERVSVYPSILRAPVLQRAVQEATSRADRQSKNLFAALRRCGEVIATDRDAPQVASALEAEAPFWASAGQAFAPWLDTLAALGHTHDLPETPGHAAPDDAQHAIDLHVAAWTRTLYHTTLRAFDDATEALVQSPRQFQAVAVGRDALRPAAAYAHLLNPTPHA